MKAVISYVFCWNNAPKIVAQPEKNWSTSSYLSFDYYGQEITEYNLTQFVYDE